MNTARAAWRKQAEQVSEAADQPDQDQQEHEQPPAANGVSSTEEGVAQGNDDEAVPLNEGEPESSHSPDANSPTDDDGGPDHLLGRIPTLDPN